MSELNVIERPTCATCVFFEAAQNKAGTLCSRYPPDCNGDYADVRETDGCGEHPDFPAYLAGLTTPPKGGQGEVGSVDTIKAASVDNTIAELLRGNEMLGKKLDEANETIAVLDLQLSTCSKSYDQLESIENKLYDEIVAKDKEIARLNGAASPAGVDDVVSAHDAELHGAVDRLVEFIRVKSPTGFICNECYDPVEKGERCPCTLPSRPTKGTTWQNDLIAERDEEIERQADVIASLRDEMTEARSTLDNLNRQNKDWAAAYDRVAEVNKSRDVANRRFAEHNDKLIQENADLRKQVAGWKHELELSDGVGDMLRNEATKLRGEVTQIGELNDRQERKLDELRQELERSGKVASGLREMNARQYNDICSMAERNEKQVNELSQANGRYQELAEGVQAMLSKRHEVYGDTIGFDCILDSLATIIRCHARIARTPN